jgi:hypothetical protein
VEGLRKTTKSLNQVYVWQLRFEQGISQKIMFLIYFSHISIYYKQLHISIITFPDVDIFRSIQVSFWFVFVPRQAGFTI